MKTQTIENIAGKLVPGNEEDHALCQDDDIQSCLGDPMVHDGDLNIDGHFDYSEGELIIKGNLTVAGTLGGDETGVLIVTGKITCKNLFMEGSIDAGEAEVEEVAFGFYEAGISNFQSIKGKVLILGCHSFEGDEEGFEHFFQFDNFSGELDEGDLDELQTILTDAAYASLSYIIGIAEDDDDDESYWGSTFLDNGILR